MKRILVVLGLFLILLGGLHAATLFTTPVIIVTPAALKFGAADSRRNMTNTFLIENAGGGKLIGKATVKPPFKIIDGGSYTLKENEAQVVTVIYVPKDHPKETGAVTNLVKFTGGSGAEATVIGKPLK
jgi:hypothetical protein